MATRTRRHGGCEYTTEQLSEDIMSNKKIIGTTAILAAALGTAAVVTAAPALAHGGGTAVRASGACTSHGSWKLKAKPDDGRIEIEFEVDVNRVGQTWHVRITDNGHLVT